MSELTGYPRKVSEAILPVVDVNPKKIEIVKRSVITDSLSGTIYTTPTNKDFYLHALHLSGFKSNATGCTGFAINATINGVTSVLIDLNHAALTAMTEAHTSLSLNIPVKIDRNTAITVTSNNADTLNRVSGIIYGYELDDVGA